MTRGKVRHFRHRPLHAEHPEARHEGSPIDPHLLRSALYIPGSNPRALAKAASLDADAVVFDLEDAVAPEARPAARERIAALLADPAARPRVAAIRVNAIGTPFFDADIALVASARPEAVLVPKPDAPDDIERIAAACRAHGTGPTLRLWLMVETARAVASLDALIRAGRAARPRLDALVVGTNDLAQETGVWPGDGRRYLVPWLMNVVLLAKSHRVAVLDGVWNDFADTAGFNAEAAQAVRMGFDGKTLIHPTQIAAAHRAFAPSAAALVEAHAIVAAFARPEHAQAGVIQLDGRMVERLHLAQAERLLARQAAIDARAAG